jgi:hypothetical protein
LEQVDETPPSPSAILNTFLLLIVTLGITLKSFGKNRLFISKFTITFRNGNTIRVSVVQKRVTGGDGAKNIDEPIEISVGEPDVTGDLIFNTVPGQTRIYIGHPKPQLTEELGLATNKFNGVLGEMILDGGNVPLWVFDSSSGNCDGASGPPNTASIGHMFRYLNF